MACIKMAYLGGGSTRAAGTMASFIWHGKEFEGSEMVLIDIVPERLEVVRALAEKMAEAASPTGRLGCGTAMRSSPASGPAISRPGSWTSASHSSTA